MKSNDLHIDSLYVRYCVYIYIDSIDYCRYYVHIILVSDLHEGDLLHDVWDCHSCNGAAGSQERLCPAAIGFPERIARTRSISFEVGGLKGFERNGNDWRWYFGNVILNKHIYIHKCLHIM